MVGQEYTDFDKGLDDGIEGSIVGFNLLLSSAFDTHDSIQVSRAASRYATVVAPLFAGIPTKLMQLRGIDYGRDRARTRAPISNQRGRRYAEDATSLPLVEFVISPSGVIRRRNEAWNERSLGLQLVRLYVRLVRALRDRQRKPVHRRIVDADLVDENARACLRWGCTEERKQRLRQLLDCEGGEDVASRLH